MASAQDALLCAASNATQVGNRIALKMVDFLEHVKNQPLGFKDLGADFLSICKILNALEESLNEHFSTNQPFPEQAIPELQRILDSTIQDFDSLQSLLEKFIEYEKGGVTAKLQKTWRMFFADKDIAKVRGSLQESRGALNMAMLLTNINPNQITGTPFGHEQSLLAARLAEHPSVSELDSASITTPSVIAPTVGSEDSDKIPIPSVSELQIHDDPIPLASERGVSPDPIPEEESATAAAQTSMESEPPKKLEVIKVDRSTLTFRIPKSTLGAKTPALQKTLLTAVENRKSTVVEQLLDRGVPPDTGDEKNAVIIAAWNRDSPTLTLLLEFGADPNVVRKSDGVTALRCACDRRPEQAEILLAYGADPNMDAPDWSPLTLANEFLSGDIVRMLLKYAADPNRVDKRGSIALSHACTKNMDPEIVLEYIAYGADVHLRNGAKWTALQAACHCDHPEIVEVLLQNKADPNAESEKYPIWEALTHPKCMKLLLEHGADTSLTPGSLELAVARNCAETATLLLDHGVSPDEKMKDHWSPLTSAIRENRPNLVTLLLSRGADLNLKGENWPLVCAVKRPTIFKMLLEAGADWRKCPEVAEYAAWQNDVESFKLLLETGMPADTPHPGHGFLPLGTAVRDNHPELVTLLLESGADGNRKGEDFPLRLATRRPQFIKPLLEHGADLSKVRGVMETAVWVNNLEAVKSFVEAGVDINEPQEGGYLPLTTSIRDDHKEIFDYLIEQGANPDLRIHDDPILLAIHKGTKYLQPLSAAGANFQLSPKAVEYAVWQNRLDAIKFLVEEAHMDPNQQHPDGHWPVFTAVRDNHPEILRYLLSKNPDISKLPNLVEYTVYRNHFECLKVEMEAGLSPDMRHPDSPTPLTTAIRENRPEMLVYLLDHGADPGAPGEGDYTPLFWAARKGSMDAVNALIEKGADVHMVREQDGQSALHAACYHGRMDMVKALIAKGADVNLVDKFEKAPMDYAAERGHDEIVIELLEALG